VALLLGVAFGGFNAWSLAWDARRGAAALAKVPLEDGEHLVDVSGPLAHGHQQQQVRPMVWLLATNRRLIVARRLFPPWGEPKWTLHDAGPLPAARAFRLAPADGALRHAVARAFARERIAVGAEAGPLHVLEGDAWRVARALEVAGRRGVETRVEAELTAPLEAVPAWSRGSADALPLT
jgi:hypothetical protein